MKNKKTVLIVIVIVIVIILLAAVFVSRPGGNESLLSKTIVFIENHKSRDFIEESEILKVTSGVDGEYELKIISVDCFDSYEDSGLPENEKIGIYKDKNIDDDCVFFLVSMDIKCIKQESVHKENSGEESPVLFNAGSFKVLPKDNIATGIVSDSVCYFSDSYDRESLGGKYAYGCEIDEGETKSVKIGIVAKEECTEKDNAVLSNDVLFLNNGNEYFVLLNFHQ